jgi:large subunit ribosomal protein L10
MNPFKLFKILEKSKTQAPAKAGNIASLDIVVPKGDTAFKPGPMLGELQKIGIQAKIDKGKIVINKDKTVVAAGEEISKSIASILSRLEIYPMEVGIDLKAAYEDQTIYTSDLLTLDPEKTFSDVQKATIKSLNLAINAEILTNKTRDILLSLAYSQMLALASEIAIHNVDALDDELRQKLSSRSVQTETHVEEEPEEEEEEEEEESEEEKEEEAAAGLGALFG